jgi:hypothetical protein
MYSLVWSILVVTVWVGEVARVGGDGVSEGASKSRWVYSINQFGCPVSEKVRVISLFSSHITEGPDIVAVGAALTITVMFTFALSHLEVVFTMLTL